MKSRPRFVAEGVDGLLRDKTRPSRIPSLEPDMAARVVAVIGRNMQRHRHQEFIRFLNTIERQVPAGKAANRTTLQSILTYHVVPGRVTAAELVAMIKAGGGRARLTTVQGGQLTASIMGERVMLTDAKGGMAHVTRADVTRSNGVIHVTDAVSLPG